MKQDKARVRILIAGDHPIFFSGPKMLLCLRKDTKILAMEANGASALQTIRSVEPDLAILNINMPQLSGVEVLENIEGDGLATRVILLTASASDAYIERAVKYGAWGIMLKDTAADELLE